MIAFLPSSEVKNERRKLKVAKEAWNHTKRDFEQIAGNANFLHLRNEVETLIARLQQYNSDESLRLAELTRKKRDFQLHHFLEQHDIDQVKIKGIGNARKLTLKSYGIETAADIDYYRIVGISGFGAATANALQDWRRRVEAKFHFNSSQSVDPADVNAIRAEFATKRAAPEARASQTLATLQKAAADAVAARSNPPPQASDAWIALKLGQEFEQALRPTAREAVQLFSLAAVCVTSFFAYSNPRYSRIPNQRESKLDNISRSVSRPEVAPPLIATEASPSSTSEPSASRPSVPAPSAPVPGATPPIGFGYRPCAHHSCA